MMPIGRVLVGELMSSPQKSTLLPPWGSGNNADMFETVDGKRLINGQSEIATPGTAVHLHRGTQYGNFATMKRP
jgi:hypothetical protein